MLICEGEWNSILFCEGEWNSMLFCEGEWNNMLFCEENEIVCCSVRIVEDYVVLWEEWKTMLFCFQISCWWGTFLHISVEITIMKLITCEHLNNTMRQISIILNVAKCFCFFFYKNVQMNWPKFTSGILLEITISW